MNKVYVLIHKDHDGELDVKAFKDKETPISQVMETMYGEDWEAQAADEEWDLYEEIQGNLDTIWEGYWVGNKDGSWLLKETEVQD